MTKITYKKQGFGLLNVMYKKKLHAYICPTFGKKAANGNYAVHFKSTGLDVYTHTLLQAKELVETFIGDLESE